MMKDVTSSDFRNLEVWQLGMDLAEKVHDAADTLPKYETYELGVQMRSSSESVPANIAEGKGRWSIRDYRKFVRYARGSLFETQSHILFAERRHYFSAELAAELNAKAEHLATKINALIRYLNRLARKPPIPGTQYPIPAQPTDREKPQPSPPAAHS